VLLSLFLLIIFKKLGKEYLFMKNVVLISAKEFQNYLVGNAKKKMKNVVFKNTKTGDIIIKFISKDEYEKRTGNWFWNWFKTNVIIY